MAVPLAKITKDYDDGFQVRCPHCNCNQWRLSKEDVGLHECEDCSEAFKIAEFVSTTQFSQDLSDLESEVRWLKDRVEELERQLGIK